MKTLEEKQAIYRKGIDAQRSVACNLAGYGHRVKQMHVHSPYDLFVEGIGRIEVKCSSYNPALKKFRVNFHRRGKLDESNVDYYIVRLEDVPEFKYPIHLAFKAPVETLTMNISFRALLYYYGKNAVLFEELRGRVYAHKRREITLASEVT